MVLRRCGHPVLACALDARGACCACADQRPEQTIYQIYIDGVGLEAGVRSSFYCTLCRQGLTHTPATPRLVHLDGSANSVTTDAQRRHQEHQRRTLQRVFGTREDVESDTYESPLAAMFSRVDEWARRQEESEPDLTILTNRLENLSQRLARLELHHEDEIYAEEASPVPLDYNMDIVHKVAAERPPPLTSELLHRSQECRGFVNGVREHACLCVRHINVMMLVHFVERLFRERFAYTVLNIRTF
ncbi:hypothetical protein PYCC9005_001460 [Savitreella phatthalungensis]